MFLEMRRKKQELPVEEVNAVLYRGKSGVLALEGNDHYPYAVPMSYVCDGQKIYFHCAVTGHKLEAIARNCKASFCIVDQDEIVPEEYTTYYRSVIVFGRIRILEDKQEKREAIEKLARKYTPDGSDADRAEEIERGWQRLCMLEMGIDHISGKEAKELTLSGQGHTRPEP